MSARRIIGSIRAAARRTLMNRRLWGAFGLSVAVLYAITWLPYPVEDLLRGYPPSWRVYDRGGELLREVVNREGARARWVNDIAPNVANATLAAEDARFYSHGGVDLRAVGRATWQNLTSGHIVSGASTVTMQMVRLHRGYAQRSLWGKVKQTFDAWRVERGVDKEEILRQYLNRAPYGAGTIGVEAASQRYFGKPHHHLSVAEAALLSGLPKAPSRLNPLANLRGAKKRQRYVLDRMLAHEMITEQEHARAVAEPLTFEAAPPALTAGHFTDYVLSLGQPREGDERSLHTTLASDIQRPIERLVRSHVESLESGGLTNAAVVVLDNHTCDILSMAGSVGYWDEAGGAVNGALAPRQPGSALKPFTYAMAFEGRYDPASALSDIPTLYPGGDGSLIRPRNYSERFVGPVLAKDALGRSLNVPAIRLANAVGIEEILARLQALGFTTFDQDVSHYGLGLTLGNGEVKLLELTQAYATFAREGLSCRARALKNAPHAEPRRLFSKQVAYLVTEALSDETLRIRAFGAANPLLFGYPVAVKTGTSSNWRDSVAVGYTDRYTVGVWSGDFAGKPMHELSGSVGAGPLFRQVVDMLSSRGAIARKPREATPPDGVDKIVVCALSGLRPAEHCPHHREIWVSSGKAGRDSCDWHRPVAVDKRNGLLASPKCPERNVTHEVYEHLPSRFAAWQAQHPHASRPPPTQWSPLCPLDGLVANAVVVTHPKTTDVFLIEPGYNRDTQTVALEAEVDPALPEVTWYVDGKQFAKAAWPYEVAWPLERGRHQLHVQAGAMRSEPVTIEVR